MLRVEAGLPHHMPKQEARAARCRLAPPQRKGDARSPRLNSANLELAPGRTPGKERNDKFSHQGPSEVQGASSKGNALAARGNSGSQTSSVRQTRGAESVVDAQKHEPLLQRPNQLSIGFKSVLGPRPDRKARKLLRVKSQTKETVDRLTGARSIQHNGPRLSPNRPNGPIIEVGGDNGAGDGTLNLPHPHTDEAVEQHRTKRATLQ